MNVIKKLSFGKRDKPLNQTASRTGRFIVIDGSDGTGKTTQLDLLVQLLRISGYDVATTDFPQYGAKSAGLVEEYLNGKYGEVNPQASSIFYAVDRFDASFKIRDWLAAGKVVVSNRYVTANAGHQGGKITDHAERITFFKWLEQLEYGIFGIPKPDLTIILDVPVAIAQQLIDKKETTRRAYNNGKQRDLHESDLEHLQAAEAVYQEIAALFPNTKLVSCAEDGKLLPPEQIHNKVWELVRRIALKNTQPVVKSQPG
jgi:dTMP kinase